MKKVTVKDIINSLNDECTVKGITADKFFTNAKPITEADKDSISWISSLRNDKEQLLNRTKAGIIVCDESMASYNHYDKCLIIVKNPRLSFSKIVEQLLIQIPAFGIHPTAYIHPEAKVNKDSFVGPFTYIGISVVEEGAIIYGHNYIYDNVVIGKNVIIHAGTVIGADGFGYEKNENNEFLKFPHVGGVVIEDNVEIGSNTSIDRGALGNTLIKTGAKIDNLVHIAHNVVIGKHSVVIANAMIGGSTKIDDYSWIAPSVSLRDTLAIGKNVTVGFGAVVTKNIPDNETWVGSPARPLNEFIELQKKLKNI